MSKIPAFEVRPSSSGNVDTEIVFVFQGAGNKAELPKGSASWGKRFQKGESFDGAKKTLFYAPFGGKNGKQNILFVGLGKEADLAKAGDDLVRQIGGLVWKKLAAEKCKTIAVQFEGSLDLNQARAFAEGLGLASYRFDKYKTKSSMPKKVVDPEKFIFVSKQKKELTELLKQAHQVIEIIQVARDWSNEPSNQGTPEYYAREAQRLSKQYGLKCKVFTEAELAKQGMGLFLGVGYGSEREGRIVVLEYEPKGTPKGTKSGSKKLAFVGKGITFDSGGISIKPSMRMEEMKHDMSGAATMFAATLLASTMKVPNRIVTVLAFTENMPSGSAIQPGNVLTSRSGKTVEIINTDAEGRLILGDALDLVQDYKPDAIVDAATLTGAVGIALGRHACALLSNNDELVEKIKKASEKTGERVWQLPAYDEYFDDMKSDVADMKNSVNDSLGGTIRGAIFLKQFIKSNTPWAHLDIAYTATDLGHIAYHPRKGASGAHVRTLAQLAADF